MAVSQRRTKAKQDDFITAQDLFGSKESMWPRTREELIQRNRPSKGEGYQVLAMAVCGTPPEGEEPHGVTDEWIWSVEEITPLAEGPFDPIGTYRRIVCSQIINPKPGCWLATWKGREGVRACRFPCPPEFFQLVPEGDTMWRNEVMAMTNRPAPSVLDMGETGIRVEGGAA